MIEEMEDQDWDQATIEEVVSVIRERMRPRDRRQLGRAAAAVWNHVKSMPTDGLVSITPHRRRAQISNPRTLAERIANATIYNLPTSPTGILEGKKGEVLCDLDAALVQASRMGNSVHRGVYWVPSEKIECGSSRCWAKSRRYLPGD